MRSPEINYCYWPTIFQSIFDWTFNLSEDFIKGKHTAYQTNSSAVLLGVMKHNLQSTVQWNEGYLIARHLSLCEESYAARDKLVMLANTDTIRYNYNLIKCSTWHKFLCIF